MLISSTMLTSASYIKSSNQTTTLENDTADWTVMFYLCCQNHISYEADKVINDLLEIGSTSDLNIIVLKDQNKDNDSRLYYIEKDNLLNLNPVYEWPDELDMGDPNTLKSFINLVKQNYPAENYALYLLSDMGSGWQGILHDSGNPNHGIPLMSIPMFANVFKETTTNNSDKIDVLILNPCVCGMIETAYELSPYIDYLVFSEEHMLEDLDKGPEYILQYKECLSNLKNNTNMSPEEFALCFTNSYNPVSFSMWVFYAYMILVKKGEYPPFVKVLSDILTKIFNSLPNKDYHIVEIKTTLSAINLTRIEDLVNSFSDLVSLLVLHQDDKDIKNCIKDARGKVREYGKFYYKNRETALYYLNFPMEKRAFDSFIDLYNLLELINQTCSTLTIKNACEKVMTEQKNTVIASKALQGDPSHGLSIYFPENKNLYNKYLWDDKITYKYEELNFSTMTHWDDFLKLFLN